MQNGDISNDPTTVVIYMDGKGLLYIDAAGLWMKIKRKLAFWMRSKNMMLSCIHVERIPLRVLMNLMSNTVVNVRVMAFTPEEEFILRQVILGQLMFDFVVDYIPTEEVFKDKLEMATILISNHFMGINSAAKRETYNNGDQFRTLIGNEIGFGGRR